MYLSALNTGIMASNRNKGKYFYVLDISGARCWWRSWFRHCATSQKDACAIPDGVIGIFH